MTLPLTPNVASPLGPPAPEPLDFPLSWLLEHASAPVQYRATVDVARLPLPTPERFALLPYTYEPALLLAVLQEPDGTWNHSMLTVPSPRAENFQGVGTIPAVRRLLEYGWNRESPPLVQARRVLFRLLAEDEDPGFLFELAPKGKAPEPLAVKHGRALLREAAAATLAQAGYESDPRLRGAARRILDRVDAFLRSPLAAKPFVRAGNVHVLAPEAVPPSAYTLMMLAFMPLFRSELYDIMERLFAYLSQPQPRQTPASLVAKKIVPEPQIVLGDPLPSRNVVDADAPAALFWLELFARLGFLRRHEGWSRLYERFLDDRDGIGVWHAARKGLVVRSANPVVWPYFPLDPHPSADEVQAEVTFRLGLIARQLGRPINVV